MGSENLLTGVSSGFEVLPHESKTKGKINARNFIIINLRFIVR